MQKLHAKASTDFNEIRESDPGLTVNLTPISGETVATVIRPKGSRAFICLQAALGA